MTTYTAPKGVFGPLLRLRREDRQQCERFARTRRLAELGSTIKSLEKWHHHWRLTHDEDYRALYPGEWCEQHHGVAHECAMYHLRAGRHRRTGADEGYEVRTYSGAVIRTFRPSAVVESALTDEERRTATRRMSEWGRGDAV